MRYGLENEAGDALEKYPYTFRMFKEDNPGISIREDMDAVVALISRVVPVADRGVAPAASDPATKTVIRGPEVKTNGSWAETWTERDLTEEELTRIALEADNQAALDAVKLDQFVINFVGMNKAGVETYIDNQVTDLASAKEVIKKLSLICLILAKRELRS